jgi:type IV pilus assembly protein PilW
MSTELLASRPRTAPLALRRRGLSLIEVLVGLAVAMISVLVIFQTLSIWDKHTQTTTSGGDMRIAGTLAMFGLERDIKLAGLGFAQADMPTMGCAVQVKDNTFNFPLKPVQISSAPDGTGIIDVLYGNSAFYVTHEEFTNATATTKQIKRRGGFKAGDLVVVSGNASGAAGSADCILVELTDTSNADGVTVAHTTGSYASFYASSASASFNTAAGTGGTFTTGVVYDLGPSPQRNRWEVVNGVLQKTDVIHGTAAFQIAEGVADIQAQYGVDTNNDFQIAESEWTTADPADWTKVLAVRVGILVRSSQFEKSADTPYAAASGAPAPTASAPAWFGTPFVMRNVDGTADAFGAYDVNPNNWRFYRYRVYQQVIPLRNMIWATSPS